MPCTIDVVSYTAFVQAGLRVLPFLVPVQSALEGEFEAQRVQFLLVNI